MADFNLYRADGASVARCFRIVQPKNGLVWNKTTAALATAAVATSGSVADYRTDLASAMAFSAGMGAFPVNIPTALPTGEYDIHFFDKTAALAATSDTIESGYGFKWDNNKQCLIGPPRELLVDRTA